MIRYCDNCGNTLSGDNFFYCPVCGCKLELLNSYEDNYNEGYEILDEDGNTEYIYRYFDKLVLFNYKNSTFYKFIEDNEITQELGKKIIQEVISQKDTDVENKIRILEETTLKYKKIRDDSLASLLNIVGENFYSEYVLNLQKEYDISKEDIESIIFKLLTNIIDGGIVSEEVNSTLLSYLSDL